MTEALTPRAWLERLVAFDTTSVKPNLPLIEDVAAYLQRAGVAHVHVNRSSDGIHANLLATLPAADGSVEGGLIFSGHTDVVPVTGQQWTSDPFKLVERDGKLYGRGSCDMKGFIAVCLSLVPEWLRSKRTKPVHLVLTYNEETDFAGVKQLLGDLGKHIEKCEGCIVGEPTEMDLIVSHKGIAAHRIICKGKAAHSSLQTSGYNAFEPASRMLSTLFELRDRFSKEGPFEDGFAIPHTTLCPSQISGGIAMNTIPERCEISFEFRNVPNHDARTIRKEIAQRTAEESSRLAAACPGASVELEFTRPPTAAFKGDPNASVVKALQAASEEPKVPVKVSFCTEAGEYQTVGVNTVVCGPGSIAQAHSANEYVSIEQLEICARVLQRVVSLMCGGSSSSGSASRL